VKAREYDETLMRITAHYVDEYEAGLQPRLDDYIRRYPHYANEIADFVAYYRSVEAPEKSQITSPAFTYETLMDRLHQLNISRPTVTTIFRIAHERSVSQDWLARQLGLSKDVVQLLEERRIDSATIPSMLYLQLAEILQYAVDDIKQYMEGITLRQHQSRRVAEMDEPYLPQQAMEGGQLSFRQVLMKSTQLSEEQRQYWLRIIKQEEK
jgi:DNA-binding Xre family transcriptional regulator